MTSHCDNVLAASSATVISTGDGDTLWINQQGQAITVRLSCLDAPESEQPGGKASAYTREASTEEDIFEVLSKIKEGVKFGDSVRQLLEFTLLGDNF